LQVHWSIAAPLLTLAPATSAHSPLFCTTSW
jgi:hypothetical protein